MNPVKMEPFRFSFYFEDKANPTQSENKTGTWVHVIWMEVEKP